MGGLGPGEMINKYPQSLLWRNCLSQCSAPIITRGLYAQAFQYVRNNKDAVKSLCSHETATKAKLSNTEKDRRRITIS